MGRQTGNAPIENRLVLYSCPRHSGWPTTTSATTSARNIRNLWSAASAPASTTGSWRRRPRNRVECEIHAKNLGAATTAAPLTNGFGKTGGDVHGASRPEGRAQRAQGVNALHQKQPSFFGDGGDG